MQVNSSPLHEYQQQAIDQAIHLGSCPILMPKGSGKTRTVLEIVNKRRAQSRVWTAGGCGPALVFCPRTALTHWKRQIKTWTNIPEDEIAICHALPPEKRALIWTQRNNYSVILTTYGVLLRDYRLINMTPWGILICDEAHKLRNRKTQTFKKMKALRYNSGYFLSGGIFRSQIIDVWPLLHLSNKKQFGSFWKFAHHFTYVIEGEYGKELGGPRNIPEFREILKHHTAYVHPSILKGKLPERQRQFLDVELPKKQRKLYDAIWADKIVPIEGGKPIISQNDMVQIIRARQCLICPGLLDETLGVGVGFETIVEHGEENPHYIVFCPFAKALPLFRDYLISQGYSRYKIFTIRGGMKPEEQQKITDNFQKTQGIMLCSLNVAESWEVLTTNVAYFIGYDWSPDVNEQAEDRLRRISSEFPYALFYYVRHLKTYDEEMLHTLTSKVYNIRHVNEK